MFPARRDRAGRARFFVRERFRTSRKSISVKRLESTGKQNSLALAETRTLLFGVFPSGQESAY